MITKLKSQHVALINQSIRNFSIATPIQKLHFVEHPRYGNVYPVVTINTSEQWFKTTLASTLGLTVVNASILYSTFVMPIFKASVAAIFANPIFLIPSFTLNYLLYQRYYVYFYGDRAHVVNMYLKPNGKQVIIETRDGESKVVNNVDIYDARLVDSKYEQRVDFHNGANVFNFIRGNSIIYDSWVLSNVLENKFIDTRNVDYDFDVTKEFTWEFRDLVEIKKRKRVVDKIV